jgi:hypothetical protein
MKYICNFPCFDELDMASSFIFPRVDELEESDAQSETESLGEFSAVGPMEIDTQSETESLE